MRYRYLSHRTALRWEPLAEARGVSAVARSSRGFMRAYEKAGTPSKLSENWKRRREGFISRHMAQVKKRGERLFERDGSPTRRHLALIMWAYTPQPKRLAKASNRAKNPWGDFIRGEYWIDPYGESHYADIDVGEAGHESIAVDLMVDKDALLDELVSRGIMTEGAADEHRNDEESGSYLLFLDHKDALPDEAGAHVAGGLQRWLDLKQDPRYAYAKHEKGIRVVDTNFYAWKVTKDTLRRIVGFVQDQLFEDEADIRANRNREVWIEEGSTGRSAGPTLEELMVMDSPRDLGKPKAADSESSDWKWVPMDELDSYDCVPGLQRILKRKPNPTARDKAEDRLIDRYGVTMDPKKGGFILPDGRFLDFSEGTDERSMDHRAINWMYTGKDKAELERYDVMARVAKRAGLIRWFPENWSVELWRTPTPSQLYRIEQLTSAAPGGIMEVEANDKKRTLHREYEAWRAGSVKGDIRSFYRGRMPNPAVVKIDKEQIKRLAAKIRNRYIREVGKSESDWFRLEDVEFPAIGGPVTLDIQVEFDTSKPNIGIGGSVVIHTDEHKAGQLPKYYWLRLIVDGPWLEMKSFLLEELERVLMHEATHIGRIRYMRMKRYASLPSLPEDRDFGHYVDYYNDPEEVEARAQEISDQVVQVAKKHNVSNVSERIGKRIKGGGRSIMTVDDLLKTSPTWGRISNYLTAESERKIREKVARELLDAGAITAGTPRRSLNRRYPLNMWASALLRDVAYPRSSKSARAFQDKLNDVGHEILKMPMEVMEQRDRILARYEKKGWGELWDKQGRPTRRHLELIAWAYTPHGDRMDEYLERVVKEAG